MNAFQETTLVKFVAHTATFSTRDRPLEVGRFQEANFFLNVNASSGTDETLDVVIQTKGPGLAGWFTLATFTQATGITTEMKTVSTCLGALIAVSCTIGGTTPSFTFSVFATLKA